MGNTTRLQLLFVVLAVAWGSPLPPVPSLYFPSALAAEPPLANTGHKGLKAKTIDDMLKLPEEEIDVGMAALLVAKECDAKVHVQEDLARLDRVAREIRIRLGAHEKPKEVIKLINEHLFTRLGYSFQKKEEDTRCNCLHHVLATGRGGCAGLSALYLSIGERLGLPVHGVCVPTHAFIRYETGDRAINVDPALMGRSLPDAAYVRLWGVPETTRSKQFVMVSLSKRQWLGVLLNCSGKRCIAEGRLAKGVDALERSLALERNDSTTWGGLACAYYTQQAYDKCIEAARESLQIDPGDTYVLCRLGLAYGETRDWERAAKVFEEATAADPRDSAKWNNLGWAYMNQNRFGEAARAFEKALALDPRAAKALGNMGLLHLKQSEYAKAAEPLARSVSLDPKNAVVWEWLGDAYRHIGKRDQAISAYREAVQRQPDNVDSWLGLAGLYSKAGEMDKAVPAWERAASQTPPPRESVLWLIPAYLERGSAQKAVALLRRAVAAYPQDEDMWNLMVLALCAAGDADAARACVRKCRANGIQVFDYVLDVLRQMADEP